MRKSHLLEELTLRGDLAKAQIALFEFYTKIQHRSKRFAAKMATNMTDKQFDENIELLKKEKNYVKQLKTVTEVM